MKKAINKIFRLFMYYTFCIVLFSSCVTEKQRRKICAECKSTSVDSVKTVFKETLKDTFIYVSSDPLIQYIKTPCDSLGKLKPFDITKYNNGVKSVVKSIGGVLVVECKIDSLKARTVFLERTIDTLNKSKEVKEITTNILTKFQRFCIWFFWGFVVSSLVYLVIKIVKIYLKTVA